MDKVKSQKPENVPEVAVPKAPDDTVVQEPQVPKVQEDKPKEINVEVVQPPTPLELDVNSQGVPNDLDELLKEVEEENKKPENQTVSVEAANAAVKVVAEEAKKTVAEELPKTQNKPSDVVVADQRSDDEDDAEYAARARRAMDNMARDIECNGTATPNRSAIDLRGRTIVPFGELEKHRHWKGGTYGADIYHSLETDRQGSVGVRIR
jgi:hypothetical protein